MSQRQKQRDHHEYKHNRADDEHQPPEPAQILCLWTSRVDRVLNTAARGETQCRDERQQALPRASRCARPFDHCGGSVVCCGIFLSVRCSERRAFIESLRVGATSFRNWPLIERTYATICCTWLSGIFWRNEGMPFGRPSTIVE